MKFSFKFRVLAVCAAALLFSGRNAQAQTNSYFGLSVIPSASSILVSNTLTYTITVTNLIGYLSDVLVSNTLPASAQLMSAVPSSGGTVTQYGNVVVFDIGQFNTFPGIAQMTLTVEPTAVGLITNLVVVVYPSSFVTNSALATNVVTEVTNIVIQADLGVAISVPTTAIITNDWMVYNVNVSNSGPDAAPSVMFTNALPPGVVLKGVLPAQPGYAISGSNLIFNLGTLNSGTSINYQFTVKPTNAGVVNFSTSVGAPGVFDPNTANNFASAGIFVTNYLAGTLTASVASTQVYNPQNGLIEQSITLSNAGAKSVPAARVVVTGLAGQELFNNVGTNSGNPFVVYAPGLVSGQSMSLLLQFFADNYFTLANSQLQAFAVPVPNLSPPPVSSTSPSLVITRFVPLANGRMLLEFPATVNRTYTVVYCNNASFSNAMIAPPSIVAPASQVQWVDYGPPTTRSAPSSAKARFYRIILNP